MPLDYYGQNLRGRSFRGQNLEGANFSYADIRSADFTGANLKNANFSYAQAGLQQRWAIFLMLISWILRGIWLFLICRVSFFAALIFDYNNLINRIIGLTIVITTVTFFFITVRQGIQPGMRTLAVPIALFCVILHSPPTVLFVPIALDIFGYLAGYIAGLLAIIFIPDLVVRVLLVIIGRNELLAFSVVFMLAVMLWAFYIYWRSLFKRDPKYSIIRDITIAFYAFGGTSFQGSDLSNANFTGASLSNTNFRQANLTDTSFHTNFEP